jgi:hypothetical protein
MRRHRAMGILLFLFIVSATKNSFAQHDLIFPVLANTGNDDCQAGCEYWVSSASVFNPNDTAATVMVTSYDTHGNVIKSSALPLTVGAFRALPSTDPSFRTGWLKVTSSLPLIIRENIRFYRVSAGVQDLRSNIYLSPASLDKRHFVRAESFGPIGISIVFPSAPNQPAARGNLIYRNDQGSTISEKELVIGPNAQVIGFLKDLLPPESFSNPIEPISGSVEIAFDQSVAVTALQFAASEPIEEVTVEAFTGSIAVAP